MKKNEDDVPVIDLTEDEDDDVSGIDLSTSADREAVLAETLAHAATLEAQYRQPLMETKRTGLWKAPLAIVLLVLSGFLLAFPPPWLAREPHPALTPEAREVGAHAALYIQAQQVQAFQARHGRLPESLQELEWTLPGIQLVRSNSRVFQLVTPGPTGANVIYDSSRPTEDFLTVAEAWGVPRP